MLSVDPISLSLQAGWSQSAGMASGSEKNLWEYVVFWKMLAPNHSQPKLLYGWNTWVFFVLNKSSGGFKLLFPFICVESTNIALYKQVWKRIYTLSLLCQLAILLGHMYNNKTLWLWYQPAFKMLKTLLIPGCLCLIFSYFSVFVFSH